jgi:TonB family protein
MKGHNRAVDQRQILLPFDPVPRASVLLLSIFAHLAVLTLIVVLSHTAKARILPEKYNTVQRISGAAYLSFNSTSPKVTRPHASLFHVNRSTRRVPESGTAPDGAAAQILREHAKQATAAIMTSIKFRQVYGFSSIDYQLAFQTAGEIPVISAADLPPRFEQYVIVEVTIDVDGRVAEARIVTGTVDARIERTLLLAIREFKYSPAKRDGTPIPSQLDIVIHIPT